MGVVPAGMVASSEDPVTNRLLTFVLCAGAATAADHVLILGFDGMSPDGVAKARTPVFHDLMRRGASTLHARGVIPTVSSPNWASMIMGAGPAEHGITSNEWQPDKFEISPVCTGDGGFFPTMFGIARKQRPSMTIGVFHDWKDFGRLVEPKAADIVKHGNGPDETAALAIDYIKSKKPTLMFVHFDHVDHAGHESGHGSPEYYQAVEKADELAGKVLAALEDAGIADKTVVLVTADHGGVGKKHGGNTMAELEIPWILAGPGVAAGKELRAPVRTYDTAATVAYLLGLKPPDCWIGRPVKEAFGK